jgi:preprotein translocase subunit SecD
MIRENWRIILLSVLVIASSVALFLPVAGQSPDAEPGAQATATNLEYGLELSGGTRIRAPLTGYKVTDVDVDPDREGEIEDQVARELDVALGDVQVRAFTNAPGSVELYTENVTREAFAAALRNAGIDVQASDVREGVTERTRQTTIRVLNDKINRGGLTGGSATITRSATGETFVLVEVPNANRSEVLDLIGSRGQVQLVAGFPAQNQTSANGTEYREVPLLSQGDFARIGTAQNPERGAPHVPVQLEDEPATRFSRSMQEFGFTSSRGVENCRYRTQPDNYGYCLFTVVDGQIVYSSSLGGSLAQSFENGEFTQDPRFVIEASNVSEARDLEVNLRAGALPTTLDLDEGTSFFVEPSLGAQFKSLSLVTGLAAVIAVSIVVFIRYREPGVAIPMILTAAAEVYLLLGFASAIGLALDLSHIAGFVAVIGTGVDDLVIIADEILQGGEIATGKVFASRFRKAFWVIGAAAATTIIAMSPLAVLSLGDLQGFAIVTIVGVLLGVLVTRPAYGNVLRNVVLD